MKPLFGQLQKWFRTKVRHQTFTEKSQKGFALEVRYETFTKKCQKDFVQNDLH